MKYFCSKDCPDLCGFEFSKNNSHISFYAEEVDFLKRNFVCNKLKKFFIREIYNNNKNFFKDPAGKKYYCALDKIIDELALFLHSNANKKILFLRGSGSIAYNMSYWDLLMSQFKNIFFIEGSPCDETGISAHIEDFGELLNPNIKNLEKANTIFLFGKNAKVTSPHLYAYLKQLKKNGKKIIYIDPIRTETANIADYYVPICPGCDNILCVLILKKLKLIDDILDENSLLTLAGINKDIINNLISFIKFGKTAFITGYGLQRYINGKNSVQWINKLACLTDNESLLYYGKSSKSNLKKINILKKNIINIAEIIALLRKDYFDALFVVAANPLITYPESNEWQKCLNKIKVIVVDTTETETAKYADYFIRVGGMFCQEDIQGSYFFDSIKIRSQRAINNLPSDVDVIKELAKKLNFTITIKNIKDLILIERNKQNERKYFNKQLSIILPSKPPDTYQLLTNSHYAYLNSQYLTEDLEKDNFIYLAPQIAEHEGIKDGCKITIYNMFGKISGICKITNRLNNVIMTYKNRLVNGNSPNCLIESKRTDAQMGLAYYNTYVRIKKCL
jgi:anaerobic selenocysteine-containing dehydrogenase